MTAIKQAATLEHGRRHSDVGLDALGIKAPANVYWNLNTPELYEEIARRGTELSENEQTTLARVVADVVQSAIDVNDIRGATRDPVLDPGRNVAR